MTTEEVAGEQRKREKVKVGRENMKFRGDEMKMKAQHGSLGRARDGMWDEMKI